MNFNFSNSTVTIFLISIFFITFSSSDLFAQKKQIAKIQKKMDHSIRNNIMRGSYYYVDLKEFVGKGAISLKAFKNKFSGDKYFLRNIKKKRIKPLRNPFVETYVTKEIVTSFEFRDKIEFENERKERELKKAEELAIRKVKLEAAEKLKKDKQRIAMEEAKKNKVENTSTDTIYINKFNSQVEYPKITKLSEGVWGETKVELGEDLYYIVDNRWDYSEDLSCYDKCYSCDFFGGKSDKEVDVKDISIYCQSKLLGAFSITETSACGKRFYSHTASNSLFGGGKYKSEIDAINNLVNIKRKECVSGKEFLTDKEKQQKISKDRATQDYESGNYRKIYPDEKDLNLLKIMNISRDELTNFKWKLEDGQTYQFNADGTLIYKAKNEYIDLWRITEEAARVEVEMQPPHHDDFLNMTIVYCSVISIVKEGDKYFLYRADTSKGIGTCIRCPITRFK